MKTIEHIIELTQHIDYLKKEGKTIGFVPTMGALHKGHISLIERAKQENDIVVCSVFVNPIQFNNKEDLEKYPRDIQKDSILLEENGCDILFCPKAEEVYAEEANESFSFGALEQVMEGKQRPGHFNGVAIIVSRLFNWVNPNRAYFGEKDFQQLAIDVQTANDKDRKTTIDKLKLTKDQKDELLKQLNIVKGTVFQSEENLKANAKVMNILGIAKQNMLDNNATLEQGITLEGLLGDKTDQRAKSTEKIKNYQKPD